MKLVEEQGRVDSYQQAYADNQRREYNQRRGGEYQRDAYGDRYGRENRGGNANRGRGMNRGRRPYVNRSLGQYREGDRRRRVSDGDAGCFLCLWLLVTGMLVIFFVYGC